MNVKFLSIIVLAVALLFGMAGQAKACTPGTQFFLNSAGQVCESPGPAVVGLTSVGGFAQTTLTPFGGVVNINTGAGAINQRIFGVGGRRFERRFINGRFVLVSVG